MDALRVVNLYKKYPSFTLDNVTFSVGEGRVCGLIGANGAGKSTTLKGVVGQICTQGSAEIFGLPAQSEEAKRKVGFVVGGFRFYPSKTVKAVARAVSSFYPEWNAERFRGYLARYGIGEEKKIAQLSEGMKVKLSVALALSHGAKLLVLDEPTSGLDPFSREDFCDTVLGLVRDEGISVLFSTHITSDLMRVADDIVYIADGKILADEPLADLLGRYSFARFTDEAAAGRSGAIGLKKAKNIFEGLVPRGAVPEGAECSDATLDDVTVCLERERRKNLCSQN